MVQRTLIIVVCLDIRSVLDTACNKQDNGLGILQDDTYQGCSLTFDFLEIEVISALVFCTHTALAYYAGGSIPQCGQEDRAKFTYGGERRGLPPTENDWGVAR